MDPATKRCCGSQYGLEFDHINPFALGGESCAENLRLRCQVHNQLEAVNIFGTEKITDKMAQHVSRLR